MTYQLPSPDAMVLPDGRVLGYADLGDPAGQAVFMFHGWVGSRVQSACLDDVARRHGLRLIAPDRPGIGISDFMPGRTLEHWPMDVAALADHLRIDQFSVFGTSGGAPYAFACGYWLADRVRTVSVSGIVPPATALVGDGDYERGMRRIARIVTGLPVATLLAMSIFRTSYRLFPDRVLDSAVRSFPEADLSIVSTTEYRELAHHDMREAFAEGGAGAAHDLMIFLGDWGFSLENVSRPVQLWHGEMDPVVPTSVVMTVAASLPQCVLRVVPDEGHYVHVACADQVLRSLAQP
jgi:pimeloyl-ACP methyl ester carboxylesterase